LGISTEDAALLLRQIGFVPENFSSQYELIGDEEAKLKLQLLQGVIEGLPREVQATIAYQIQMGDYQGAVNTAVNYGSKHPITMPTNADTSGAAADLSNFRKRQASVPIYVPVRASTSGSGSGWSKPSANAAEAGVGVGATAAPAMVSAAASPTVLTVAAPTPAPVTINLNAGVVGNRYDLQRWVRAATREQQRLGRLS
jgi:hypothetical protein